MNFRTPCAALALIASTVPAHADSFAFTRDKQLHLGASAAAGVAAVALFPDRTPIEQFGLAMIPGTLKEANDWRNPSPARTGWSWHDMAYNAIGAATGVYLGGLVIAPQRGGLRVAFAREI